MVYQHLPFHADKTNRLEFISGGTFLQIKFCFKDGTETLLIGSRELGLKTLSRNYNYLDTEERICFENLIKQANMLERF